MAIPVIDILDDEIDELDPELATALQSRPQGEWSEEDYLALTDDEIVFIEYADGFIEVLPMPTDLHQTIILYLASFVFLPYAIRTGGKVLDSGIRVRLWPRKFCLPDIVFLRSARDARRAERIWNGADLVVEVVSPSRSDRRRDLVTKRREYARAGILEYWIVDPHDELVTVLQLKDNQYVEHGVFARGDTATSALLPDVQVEVHAVFDAQ